MTEKEYYYNMELIELLENIIRKTPDLEINDGYWLSYIDDLKERLNNIFHGERKEESK